MTNNMNQFAKQIFLGQLDLNVGGLNTSFTVRIDPDSAATDIGAGEGLRFVDGGANDPNGVPLCDILAADANISDGVRIYDAKSGVVQPGEIAQMSFNRCVQYMEAAAVVRERTPFPDSPFFKKPAPAAKIPP